MLSGFVLLCLRALVLFVCSFKGDDYDWNDDGCDDDGGEEDCNGFDDNEGVMMMVKKNTMMVVMMTMGLCNQ